MPLSRFSAEQLEARRWVAEVEAGGMPGGPPFKRVALTADSFAGIMEAVDRTMAAQMPSGMYSKPMASEGLMVDHKNPNQRPGQEPVQRVPGDQANTGDASKDAPKSLPDDMRPDQRQPGPGGTDANDDKGTAPIPPTPPGQKNPNPVRDPDDAMPPRDAPAKPMAPRAPHRDALPPLRDKK